MFLKKNPSMKLKSDIKNIVTLNAYTDEKYIYKGSSFKSLKKLNYNTSNFITSYVSNKNLIGTTVDISRSIPEEDILDVIDIKAYEELGLDQASNYIVSSAEIPDTEEERRFHIFVAKSEVLDKHFLPIKQNTKYIDLIVPAPLLYKTLYRREILKDKGVHCFVYFTKHDASVTFYKNGEYLYSKSIEYSLEQIYEKYCEIVGESVDEEEFHSILKNEGLKTVNKDYQENFMKIFSDIFITINDIVIYAKRTLQIELIDNIYIGSSQGPIAGLDEYSQNYLGLQSSDLIFDYGIKNDEWYIDQLQYLMLLNSFDHMEDESSVMNLTSYSRPPSFVNRSSGQFIISILLATTLGLAWPISYLVRAYFNNAQIFALNIENKDLTKESNKYKKIISEKLAEIAKLDKDIDMLSTKYKIKTKTLSSIYDKKVNYRLKSGTFHTIAKELHKFDIKINLLYSQEDTMWISLVSSDDRKLTELIKYISDTHFEEIDQIDIERIQKDPDSDYYTGLLKVDLR